MTIALPVYPDKRILPGLGFNTKWSPRFFNMPTQTMASGADIDLACAQYPLHDFELVYNFLRDKGVNTPQTLEFKTLIGFFGQIGGVSGRFVFKHPDDNAVTQQLLGVGDGSNQTFTFQRTFGANGFGWTEPVGAINTAEIINIYVNNSATRLDDSLYTLDTSAALLQTVTLDTAPGAGQNVRADFSFFYYCKFSDDTATFEKFMNRLWMLNQIKIHSCRQGA